MQHPDRRTLKTKKAIRGAFAALLAQKNINEISVKDIADKADISRKTFYNYYEGIWQLMDEIENEIVTAFADALSDIDFEKEIANPVAIADKLVKIVNSDIEFYGNIMRMSGNRELAKKIMRMLGNKMDEAMQKQMDLSPTLRQIAVRFTIAGLVEVYKDWFKSGCALPADYISQAAGILIVKGIGGIAQHPGAK